MRVAFVFLILILTACIQNPTPDKVSHPERWLQHQLDITAVTDWKLTARIGIQTKNQGVSATLHWQQTFSNYDLRFIAPLAQGSYLFTGSPNRVTMATPDEKVYQADNAETLMQSSLGYSVYLNGLQYWVRGIPEPGRQFNQLSLDESGRLLYMKQSDFSVSILRYAELDGISLPEKLVIRGDDVELRIIIQQWDI